MKDQIDILVKIQKIETEKMRMQSILDGIPHRLEKIKSSMNEFEQQISKEAESLDSVKKKYRSLEMDLKATTESLKKNKEKLLTVKTNKEYQAQLKAIEDIEAKSSQLEDELLEYLEKIEALDQAIKKRKIESAVLYKTIQDETQQIKKEEKEATERLSELKMEEEEITKVMAPDILQKLKRVKQQVKGAAIASVTDAICDGCKMKIPPQLYNELHKLDSIQFCPHCQRIIYWASNSG